MKEQITDKEAICMIVLFIMGSTLILGIGGETKNDAWIAAIIGIIFSIPVYLIYSRIVSIFQGKDLYEILELVFGRFVGKFVALFYLLYVFILGALVIRNFGEFVNTLSLPETPIFVIMLALGLLCITAARLGIEVIGRTSAYLITAVFAILLIVQVLIIPQMQFNFIKPVLYNGFTPILKSGYSALSFPFSETVVFISVFFTLKTKKSARKVYLWGLFLAGITIVVLTIRNILVLGKSLGMFYFPSYIAVSHIAVGNFLQRIEVTVSFVFAVAAFAKISVCLFSTCKGIERLFNLHDYRSVTIQVGMLMIYFSYIIFNNIMDMRYWAFKVYPYYSIPFQIIIPLVIWIIAEFKKKGIENKGICT